MKYVSKIVDICLLNIEDRGSNVFVSLLEKYENGSKKTVRKNVKKLGGYYNTSLTPKAIISAKYLDTVYCGFIKSDVRLLFLVRLRDGSMQIVQAREGTKECVKMLELSEQEENAVELNFNASTAKQINEREEFHQKVEGIDMATILGAGVYTFGKNIPNGTYDLIAVRGKGYLTPFDLEGEEMSTVWFGVKDDNYAKAYRGISSDDLKKFAIDGSVEFEIKKAEMIEIE